MIQVPTVVAHGYPLPALEAAWGLQRRTVQAWVDAAGKHCAQIHEQHVLQFRDLGAPPCGGLGRWAASWVAHATASQG